MGKRHRRKDRVLAFILTLMIVFTTIMPAPQIDVVKAEEDIIPPETTVTTTFSVVDTNDTPVSYDELNIFDANDNLIEAGENDSYTLTVGTEYSCVIKKSGYKDFECTFEATADIESTKKLTWDGELDEIKVDISDPDIASGSAVSMNVGDSFTLEVTNKIEGATYTCATSDEEVLSVTDNDDETWTVTANKEDDATITIESDEHGDTYELTVTVSKKASNVDFDITPNQGAANVESVVLTVTGLESDAAGEVQFWVNNQIEDTLTLIESNTWTYAPAGGLVGDYTFQVKYLGDNKYNPSSSEVKTVNGFSQPQSVDFKTTDGMGETNTNPHRVQLSADTATPQAIKLELANTFFVADGNEIRYESSNTDILEITQDPDDDTKFTVTVVGSGEAYITVTAPESGNYLEATDTYYFYVEETYTIEDIASQLVFDDYEKTYDGKKDVELIATLPADKLSALHIFNQDNIDLTKGLKFTFTGTVEDADAGTYDAVEVTEVEIVGFDENGDEVQSSNIENHIVLDSGTKLEALQTLSVKILPRTVYLGTKDFPISYGQNVQDELKNLTEYVVEVPDTENLNVTGILESDNVDLSEFKVTANQSIYNIGSNADVIIVDFAGSETAVDKYPNYNFVQGDDSVLGDLTVTQQNVTINDIFAAIGSFTVEDGVLHAVKEESTNINSKIWISDGKLKASVTGENYEDYYDKVMFQVGETEYDLTDGYDVSDLDTSAKIDGSLYLQKEDNKSSLVPFSFYVDKEVPTFSFGNWSENESLSAGWQDTIKFGNYEKATYTIEGISWNDDNTDSSVESSGVKEWSYYVHKVTSDADLTAEALQTYVETNPITWIDGNNTTSITLEGNEGNYIVLVKIKDNVNNSVVYTSNGIVFDVKEPNITIVGLNEDETTYQIESNKYYNDDVKFKVEFNDEEVTSGLATIKISIIKDGNVVEQEDLSLTEGRVAYKLEELEALATKTCKGVVSKDLNSNDLAIEVVATDQAGNTYTETQKLMIDSEPPKMTVEYAIADADITEDILVTENGHSGYYTNKAITATVEIIERNFDPTKVLFDIDTNITDYQGISLDKICNGTVEGVKAELISDTGIEAGDERKVVYKITFTGKDVDGNPLDITYRITPSMVDMAENPCEEVDFVEFTVDTIVPEMSVSFDNDDDVINEKYFQTVRKMTITMKERNIDKALTSGMTFDVKAGVGISGQTAETVTLDKLADYGISYEWTIDDQENLDLLESTGERTVTLVLTFGEVKDSEYYIVPHCTDLAGNSSITEQIDYGNSICTTEFVIDDTNPYGTITLENYGTWDKILDVLTFQIFDFQAYNVILDPKDATAGILETYYYVQTFDEAVDEDAEHLEEADLKALDESEWQSEVEPLEPNQQFVVYAKLVDKAENVAYISTLGAVSDAEAPKIELSYKMDGSDTSVIVDEETSVKTDEAFYRDDLLFDVTITDPETGGTYSGLKKVWYTISAAGNKTVEAEELLLKEYTIDTSSTDEQREQVYDKALAFSVDAEKYNSNDVVVTVYAKDNAGNQSSTEVHVQLDSRKPAMSVSFDNNSVKNGKYFNAQRIMTITVNDRNIDTSDTQGMTFDVKAGVGIDTKEAAKNVTLKGLAAYGISYEWKTETDTQKDKSVQARTDERTMDLVLKFTEDNEYYIVPHCTDLAGNTEGSTEYVSGTECTTEFVIDKTAPVINVTYNQNGITANEANRFYTQDNVEATIRITEQNFWLVNGENKQFSKADAQPEQMNFSATSATEAVPAKDMAAYYDAEAENTAKWSKAEDNIVYTTKLTFGPDANYTFGFTYTDLAGNPATYEPHYFTVDKTVPNGEIAIGEKIISKVVSEILQVVTFNIFQNTTYLVEITSTDVTAGVAETYYYKSANPLTAVEIAALERGSANGWQLLDVGNKKFNVSPNEQFVVYGLIIDKCGNETILYPTRGAVADDTKPDVAKLEIISTPRNGIYKDDVKFEVTVTDPTVGNTYSGIKKVWYTVTATGNVNKTQEFDPIVDNSADIKQSNQTVTEQFTVTANDFNSNKVTVQVHVEDFSGNLYDSNPVVFAVDATDTAMKVSFNNDADVKNGKYFNTDRVMTITVTDRNIDMSETDGMTFDVKAGVNIAGQEVAKNVTLKDLRDTYGVNYEWMNDSQANVEKGLRTDARTADLVLTFNKDNEYYIVPHCMDLGGRSEASAPDYGKSICTKEFVIDKTAPVIKVTYDQEGIKADAAKRFYTQNAVKATIQITEQNFWLVNGENKKFSKGTAQPEQMNFSETSATETVPEKNMTEYYDAEAEKTANWSANGVEYTTTMTFAPDANYTFGFTYTDLAGNPATYEKHYFTVDDTAPETGSIVVESNEAYDIGKLLWKVITFDIFYDDSYTVKFTSGDNTAGMKATYYHKSHDALTEEEVKALADDEWTLLNPKDMSFKVSPNEQFVVYEKMVDKALNVSYVYPKQGAIADNAAPTIKVTNETESRNGIHNSDVTLKVVVKDPTVGDTYSGIERVWYTITADGNVTAEETKDLVVNTDKVQGNQDWTGKIVVDAKKFNSNNVKVQVFAKDFTGNEYVADIIPLKIDVTEPTITITYDLNEPLNEKYYNATRTATITVTERNFDETAARFEITNTDGTPAVIGEWTKGTDTGVLDSTTNTCKVTFAADGDYTVAFDCTDLAGNDSQVVKTEDFTIDQTIPEINVSFDNNEASNGTYYAASRTATITVNEHNFNGSELQASIVASLKENGIAAPGVNGWSTAGDVHSATIHFGEDGDYSFTLNYSDLAGNAAQEFVVTEFTVDQTKPVVEILDIVDHSANNGEVAPRIEYSDVNYDVENVSISIEGVKHELTYVDGTRTSIEDGQSIKLDDFAHEASVDDVYTLTASITDRAGNVETQSVLFSVNRFGSTYLFSEDTEALLDKYYINQEQDIVVTEINVDTLEKHEVSYGRDGELFHLTEGEDYTVTASGSEVSWQSYEYVIAAKNFMQEGLYNITIDSTDRATNEVNNKVKASDIEFVVDKTKPSVVITGIEDNGSYKEDSRDITIVVADNVAMGNVDVHLNQNSKPDKSYDAEEILAQKGELQYQMNSSKQNQTIGVIATDAAGNAADLVEYTVLISSNALILFVNNTPLLVGTVGAVAAAGGIGIFAFRRRKIIK